MVPSRRSESTTIIKPKTETAKSKKTSKKKVVKKKTKKNALPYTKAQLRKIINQPPLHQEHKNAQKLLTRLLNRMERMSLGLKKLDDNLAYEIKRTAQLLASMRLKKTVAAKNSVKRAKQRLINSKIKHRAQHSAFKELISEIKICLKEVRYFEKKEAAKNKAVSKFIKQWEQDYDKKVKKPGE